MHRDRIEKLARMAAELGAREVSFGVSAEAYRSLAALDGAEVSGCLYEGLGEEDFAITVVRVSLHGVQLRAQCPARSLTPRERATLERAEKRDLGKSCRYEPGVG